MSEIICNKAPYFRLLSIYFKLYVRMRTITKQTNIEFYFDNNRIELVFVNEKLAIYVMFLMEAHCLL